MKNFTTNKFYGIILLLIFCNVAGAQYATQALDNLASPTKISQSLLPAKDSSKNLGSSNKNWKDIYLKGSIYYGTASAISFKKKNTITGLNALYSNTTGDNNTANGYNAMFLNTTGFDNTANGSSALYSNAAGSGNTATGAYALYSNTSGSNNTANGYLALSNNSTGNYNTAVGVYGLDLNTTGTENTVLGFSSMYSNTTGSFNTALGKDALYSNTTGGENTATGHGSMFANTTGSYNAAYGRNSLHANSTGTYNTAIGYAALNVNTTGNYNTAIGYAVLYSNTTGNYNTALGANGLYANTTGTENTSIGYASLQTNTTGSFNTATGKDALYSNTTGYDNTAIGHGSMFANTTGYFNAALGRNSLHANTNGYFNTAVGYASLYANTTGWGNTANGYYALHDNTTGRANTAFGEHALTHNTGGEANTAVGEYAQEQSTSGSDNTAVGVNAGDDDYGNGNTEIGSGAGFELFNDSYNTFIGYIASPSTSDFVASTAIGAFSTTYASQQVRVGYSATLSIGGQVGWTTFSDGRFKKNIKENVPGLDFINQLKPVTYQFDLNGLQTFTGTDKKFNSLKPEQRTKMNVAFKNQEQKIYTGFIAQEVELTAKKLGYDFSGVDAPKNDKDMYGLRYDEFVAPLVKAVQELSKMNDDKDAKINELETRLSKLEAMMNTQTTASNNSSITSFTATSLEQNTPNPFNRTTTISYNISQKFTSAKIVFTNNAGTILKQINVSQGKGTITANTVSFSSGVYYYSLYVDDKLIATRQMIAGK